MRYRTRLSILMNRRKMSSLKTSEKNKTSPEDGDEEIPLREPRRRERRIKYWKGEEVIVDIGDATTACLW